jgi:hypothetical protein
MGSTCLLRDYSGLQLSASGGKMSDQLQFVACWRRAPMAEADDKLKFVGPRRDQQAQDARKGNPLSDLCKSCTADCLGLLLTRPSRCLVTTKGLG